MFPQTSLMKKSNFKLMYLEDLISHLVCAIICQESLIDSYFDLIQ